MEWLNKFSKVMDILSQYASTGIGISELSRESNISKSTLHRMLNSMLEKNIVYQHKDSRKYYLGARPMYWGSQFIETQDPGGIMSQYCKELADNTGLYCYLSHFQMGEVYCIYAHQPSEVRNTYFVKVGQRMPVHCSSSAKVIIAFKDNGKVENFYPPIKFEKYTDNTLQTFGQLQEELNNIRKENIGYCLEEMEENVSAISAPIFHEKDKVNMSLSVVGKSSHLESSMDTLIDEITVVAQKASKHLQSIERLRV